MKLENSYHLATDIVAIIRLQCLALHKCLPLPTLFSTEYTVQLCSLRAVGELNLLPQSISFWCKGYFSLVDFKGAAL